MSFDSVIAELEKRKKKLEAININTLILEIIKENPEFILNLNRINQIFNSGEQTDGAPLSFTKNTTGFYAKSTAKKYKGSYKYKRSKTRTKKEGSRYFMSVTDNWLNSFYIVFTEDSFEIKAADIYSGQGMGEGYTENFLGLSEDSLDILRNFVANKLPKKIKEKLP